MRTFSLRIHRSSLDTWGRVLAVGSYDPSREPAAVGLSVTLVAGVESPFASNQHKCGAVKVPTTNHYNRHSAAPSPHVGEVPRRGDGGSCASNQHKCGASTPAEIMVRSRRNADGGHLDPTKLTTTIRDLLLAEGFADVGTCPAVPPPGASHLDDWLSKNLHGGLSYMAVRPEERKDPSVYHAAARWMVVAVARYPATPLEIPDGDADHEGHPLTIAAYAARRDYHEVLRRKLHAVRLQLKASIGLRGRVFVDSAPVMEKAVAVNAGLGRIGRNTCLIHPIHGSRLLIGGFTVDRDLVQLHPPGPVGDCGECRRCQAACPMDAISGEGVLDARRCLSYWTTEHAGELPPEIRDAMRRTGTLFGCDICQTVCPENSTGPQKLDTEMLAPLDLDPDSLDAEHLERIEQGEFEAIFGDTPVARLGLDGLLRNLRVARK